MMTKKQFIALADVIKVHNRTSAKAGSLCRQSLCRQFTGEHLDTLARFLAAQNPRFNRQRWLDYIAGNCGPSGGKVSPTKLRLVRLVHRTRGKVSPTKLRLVRLVHRTLGTGGGFYPCLEPAPTVTEPITELSHAEKTRAELDAELADW